AGEDGAVSACAPCEVSWRVLLPKLYQCVCPTGAPFQTTVVQGRDRVLLQSDHDVGFQRTQRHDRPRKIGGDGLEGGRGGPVAVTHQTPIVQVTLHDGQARLADIIVQAVAKSSARSSGMSRYGKGAQEKAWARTCKRPCSIARHSRAPTLCAVPCAPHRCRKQSRTSTMVASET